MRYNFKIGSAIIKEVLEYAGLRPWKVKYEDQQWGCIKCRRQGKVTRVNPFYGCYVCEPSLVTRVADWELPWLYCQRTDWKWFSEDNYAWWPGCYYSRFREKATNIHLFRVGLNDPDSVDSWGYSFTPETYGFYHLPIGPQVEE
jgi:hypothetical protein